MALFALASGAALQLGAYGGRRIGLHSAALGRAPCGRGAGGRVGLGARPRPVGHGGGVVCMSHWPLCAAMRGLCWLVAAGVRCYKAAIRRPIHADDRPMNGNRVDTAATTRAEELRSFLFLSVVMAPVLAVVMVVRLRLPGLDVPARRRPARAVEHDVQRTTNCTSPAWSCIRRRARCRAWRERDRARCPAPGARRVGQRQAGRDARGATRRRDDRPRWRASSACDGVLSAALVYQCADTPRRDERGDSRCRCTAGVHPAVRRGRGRGAVAGIPLPGAGAAGAAADAAGVKWSQGAVPLLRHRLRRDGGRQGQPRRRHARRPAGRGQPRPQLRQGLLPVQDHVRRGPPDDAAAAHEGRQVRQGRRVRSRVSWDTGLRRDGRAVQARAQGQGPDRGRHVRLRPVDRLGGLRGAQADEGRLPLATTSTPTRATAWPRPRWASCAPSASTSRWAATTTSRPPTRSCCGARTWPRCTRSCGRG